MKRCKKYFALSVLCLTVFQVPALQAQLSFTEPIPISKVLNMRFPDSFSVSKDGFVHTYIGGDSLSSFEITYFDTIIVKSTTNDYFNLSLKGFVAGKFAGAAFKAFDLRLTDTVIGQLPGFFISGTTDDLNLAIKKFDCFVTIANSHSYWFFYYPGNTSLATNKAAAFFSGIQFDRGKIKEAAFKLRRFKKHKAVGKTWYPSPELDYPMPPKETMEDKQTGLSSIPRPLPPPIDRRWLVKASKLASDYVANPSQADKQYKKKSFIIVEGIVKEIRETEEPGVTMVILNGSPSKTDVQCELRNAFTIKNLKKGMKATFYANCDGINGNVILSKCSFIEKPTYQ